MSYAPQAPCYCPGYAVVAQLASKTLWLRVNRLVAWALLVSPVVQIAMGSNFVRGLLFDLGLLALHGALSLALFGLPRAHAGEGWMLWLGIEPNGLSPRGKFLMGGWQIALGVGAFLPIVVMLPWPALLVAAPVLLAAVLLPFTVLGHVYRASDYAARRWHLKRDNDVVDWGCAVVVFFIVSNTFNLFR